MEQPVRMWTLAWASGLYEIEEYPLKEPAFSLDQSSLQLPEGAYTTFRTYNRTRCLRFDEHIQRLIESATRKQIRIDLEAVLFRRAIRAILLLSPYSESRLRVTLDLSEDPGKFYVALEALHLPSEANYREGVRVRTRSMHREDPKAKLTNFIQTASSLRDQLEPGVNELLMVSEKGLILEGLSSNFFACQNDEIFTAEAGVLSGITRQVVLDIARHEGIPVCLEPVRLQDLDGLDECFLTSATRGVLPIRQIDDLIIGAGKPGLLTRFLMKRFEEWISKEVEEV